MCFTGARCKPEIKKGGDLSLSGTERSVGKEGGGGGKSHAPGGRVKEKKKVEITNLSQDFSMFQKKGKRNGRRGERRKEGGGLGSLAFDAISVFSKKGSDDGFRGEEGKGKKKKKKKRGRPL